MSVTFYDGSNAAFRRCRATSRTSLISLQERSVSRELRTGPNACDDVLDHDRFCENMVGASLEVTPLVFGERVALWMAERASELYRRNEKRCSFTYRTPDDQIRPPERTQLPHCLLARHNGHEIIQADEIVSARTRTRHDVQALLTVFCGIDDTPLSHQHSDGA